MMRALEALAGGLLVSALPQVEVDHLALHSHVAEVHLDTGARESGVCPPELVVALTRMGDPLVPRPEAYALSPGGPAGSLGMTLSPLRLRMGEHQVSVLDLDMAYETSGEGSGTALQVGVLKLDFSF